MRANSAAIHPRFRVIFSSVERRCASVHSGNASRKLNSAVFFSFGSASNSNLTPTAAMLRAIARGNTPSVLISVHATTYCNRSFIEMGFPLVLSRQYDGLPYLHDTLSMLDSTFCDAN